MTGLVLQDSKKIPITCNTKNHYKTTQDLGLQSNVTAWKTTVLSLLEKRSFYQDIGRVHIFKNSPTVPADIKEERRTL